jgi:hypothetical protein
LSLTIPLGSAVYVRYKDHVLFRQVKEHVIGHAERETIGWLIGEDLETMCIHWDRNVRRFPHQKTSFNSGLLILKSCILEIRMLPLQNISRWPLSCQTNKLSSTEYALPNEKRKTQIRRNGTGAEN